MLKPVRVFAVMMVLAVAVSVLAGWHMLTMKRDALEYARASGANILLMVERELLRDLDVHAQTLQTINNVVNSADAREIAGPALAALVRGHAAGSVEGTIVVTDVQGQLLQSLHNESEIERDLSRREYFTAAMAAPGVLHLSHPFLPSYDDIHPATALSRSVTDSAGNVVGVAAVIKDLRHLNRFIEGLKTEPSGIVSIRLLDGTLLAQWPASQEGSQDELGAFHQFVASGLQEYVVDGFDEVEPHWRGYQRVGNYPVVVGMDVPRRDIFRAWETRTVVTSGLLLLFNLATVALAYGLTRHLRHLDVVENRLRAEASTDALTGLHNRRWFDEKSRAEWHRHLRGGGELAILMLDIDQFKAYNDHYGHPMGDKALARVAEQVQLACRREGDGAARYGGEEFVVILPMCDLAGALVIAENVRQAVHAQALPHEKGANGVVTVSIGVASTSSTTVESVEALVKVADDCLYRAKAGGRNRVEG
ncbi:diguanylate cyclase [Uliginosibacterium sp. sgz301328]|uniref:sensor domain-containing diguanylate cyclase n=1 Tax=Uliginosibacterium sp. sgz301328 TaxID=3243764 RepID=UPI00359D7B3F